MSNADRLQLDKFGCLGNTIKVAAGHYVDIVCPSPEQIDLVSIAAALSKICRFGGHCPRFYSVAEHCVHAMNLAKEDGMEGDELAAILMHDAAEAYIGDVVKPLKVRLHELADIEQAIELTIAERFELVSLGSIVKRYDRMMLKAEKLAFWPNDAVDWHGFADVPVRKVQFEFWCPRDAEYLFLTNARLLGLDG